MAGLEEAAPPGEHKGGYAYLRERLAAANTRADYAQRLWSGQPPRDLHERVETEVKEALETYYELGQLAAMPGLIERQRTARKAPQGGGRTSTNARSRAAAVAGPPADPWVLTDPATRPNWQRDPSARDAIDYLWQHDPDPARTLAIHDEIQAAFERGDIASVTDSAGASIGPYFCCPWSPIYTVKRSVTLGGQRLRPMQQFTYEVSAEKVAKGLPFERRILIAEFTPTDRVDYCDPRRAGGDD
jgi:hypothetical protein